MLIRDRIIELRRVPARTLKPHPKNWRTHPARQADALRGVLAEVGYAAALVARQLEDGSLQLIDGHLRAETTPEQDVPVLVLDVTAAEADKLLATLDPLGNLAGTDANRLDHLLSEVATDNPAVAAMLDELSAAARRQADATGQLEQQLKRELEVPRLFQLVVQCAGEEQQRELYERLTAEGYPCRVQTLGAGE